MYDQSQTGISLDKKLSPVLVCTVMTLLMLIAVLVGFLIKSAVLILLCLLPVVIYEIYRTRGPYTTLSSWLMLAVLIGEIVFIIFSINYNLADYFGSENAYLAGQNVPLGDIKILGPTLMAVFSLVLLIRTYGPYTKWLAVIIFVSAFATIYILNPNAFHDLLKMVMQNNSFYY